MKKRGVILIIVTLILFMLPISVNAEGFTVEIDAKGAVQEYDPIIADTWDEVYLSLPNVYSVIPEMQIDRHGYYFAGWYYDETYTQEVTPTEPEEHNLTVYAKWLKSIDMSQVNLTVNDLIAGTEYSIKDDNTGGFSRISVPTPSVISNNNHVNVKGVIITNLNDNSHFEGITEKGNDYYIDLLITPDDDYAFTWENEPKILINGKGILEDYTNNLFMDLTNIEVEEYGGVIVNCSAYDATLRVRVTTKEEENILMGDMNHNGKIDLKDIILLIKKYLKID